MRLKFLVKLDWLSRLCLNLKCRHLADHVYVVASALGKKYIF